MEIGKNTYSSFPKLLSKTPPFFFPGRKDLLEW
jgi:hypothetical protein